MKLWSRLRSWLGATLRRSRMESEMDAELRFHMEAYAEDLIRGGMPGQEALRRAPLAFWGAERAEGGCRGARGGHLAGSLAGSRMALSPGSGNILRLPLCPGAQFW